MPEKLVMRMIRRSISILLAIIALVMVAACGEEPPPVVVEAPTAAATATATREAPTAAAAPTPTREAPTPTPVAAVATAFSTRDIEAQVDDYLSLAYEGSDSDTSGCVDTAKGDLDKLGECYRMADSESDTGFSGCVLIARGDVVLLSKCYGMADYQERIPNTPHTVFPIASITKQFTATAILQL